MKQFVCMILLLFFLLIFHKETIAGTEQGILLWYQTLIPSLLPFILVTNALAETNAYQAAATYFQKLCPNKIYEIMAAILGNLCGYPIGGKIINDFVKNGYITPNRANKLLAVTSQASPMFLIGYIHLHILEKSIPLPIFLLSIYVPAFILYAILTPRFKPEEKLYLSITPHKFCMTGTFLHAVQIMVMIGIYVIIFSIILEILFPFCRHITSKLLLSLLEITTGLKLLNTLSISANIKTALVCAISSFGGLCSAFQIKGVLDYENASIKKYLSDKIILSTGTFFFILFYSMFYQN